MEDFQTSMESISRRIEWARATDLVEQAVRFKLDAMNTRFAKASEEDREALAQAWARILQG
jgi:hypothetical protein